MSLTQRVRAQHHPRFDQNRRPGFNVGFGGSNTPTHSWPSDQNGRLRFKVTFGRSERDLRLWRSKRKKTAEIEWPTRAVRTAQTILIVGWGSNGWKRVTTWGLEVQLRRSGSTKNSTCSGRFDSKRPSAKGKHCGGWIAIQRLRLDARLKGHG